MAKNNGKTTVKSVAAKKTTPVKTVTKAKPVIPPAIPPIQVPDMPPVKERAKHIGMKNLKNFPKGVSGNPKGRPRKIPALDILLANVLDVDDYLGRNQAELILLRMIKKAKAGDVRAAEIILDRTYGKPKQSMEIKAAVDLTAKDIEFS